MKTKYYTKMLFPLCFFGIIFRVFEILFAIEPSSGFYYTESVIPLLCNIYSFLVIGFFLSEIFMIKTETKSVRKRFGSITNVDKVLFLLAAVFILSFALKHFLIELNVNYSYSSIGDMLRDSKAYVLGFAVLSCIFIVFFASAPKKYSTSSVMSVLSVSITVYYLIRLFTHFMDLNEILSKAYGTQAILLLGFLTLSFMNFSKMLAGLLSKRFFIAFGLCSVYLASIHLAEFVISFIPGNPYNISIDIFAYAADFFCAAVIMRLIFIVSQKKDKNETKLENTASVRAISSNDEPVKEN